MRNPLKNIILFLLASFLCVKTVSAQIVPPPPPPPPPKPLPIDGGLTLLILSGVIYGLFELRKK
ncbi:PID-CTERM protein-sorting domain-containing protein [Lutibacter sp.]|uniref:PID-CTERM protein-sorting domain-containing protein n=1 Tax=Lutibacter sp. TaxID=1925666 RepID=UPI0035677A71